MSRRKLTRKGRRADRKPVTLSAMPEAKTGDIGPDTPAQRQGRIIEAADWACPETGKRMNPNGIRRARKIDLIESYYRRSTNPLIDARQFKAAQALRNAYEQTQKSAPAIKKVQVDTTPKPDANVAIMIDRISGYHSISKLIPSECMAVIDTVVMQNRAIGSHPAYKAWNHAKGVDLLRQGLDAIAEGLRL